MTSRLRTHPSQLARFIGREADVADVRRMLDSSRMVTIVGAGGIGKTRLALEVVAATSDVVFVELAAVTQDDLVAQAVAGAVGVDEEARRSASAAVVSALRDTPTLLVLDNCEHVIDACAALAADILAACPQVRVLATSRARLAIPGENAFRLRPLALPEIENLSGDAALDFDAIALFADRARMSRVDFAVDDGNAADVVRLCRRLDGLPLALELAAARSSSMTPREIAAALADDFRLLSGGRAVLDRQKTIRASIEWSVKLLSKDEGRLLAQLSIFAGTFDRESARAIASGDVDALTGSLTDQSLVQADDDQGITRFRLLEPVREYARDMLIAQDEQAATAERHLAWFSDQAARARLALEGAGRREALEAMERDEADVRSAIRFALATGDAATAVAFAADVAECSGARGQLSEARTFLREALALGGGVPDDLRVRALGVAGDLAYRHSDAVEATTMLEESLALGRSLGLEREAASALHTLGLVAWDRGDRDRARELATKSLELDRHLGDVALVAKDLMLLGDIARASGDLSSARALHEEALEHFRDVGDAYGTSGQLHNLAQVASDQGRYDEARTLLERGLELSRAEGDDQLVAHLLRTLGLLVSTLGDAHAACDLLRESLELRRRADDRRGMVDTLMSLGIALDATGDGDGSRAASEESLAMARSIDDARRASYALANLSDNALRRGDPARARRLAEEAVAMGREAGDVRGIGYGLLNAAEATIALGWPDARGLLEEAAAALERAGDAAGQGLAVDLLSKLAAAPADGGLPVFARDGDAWLLSFRQRAGHVRDAKGMRYLAQLVGYPHRDFSALELVALAEGHMVGHVYLDADVRSSDQSAGDAVLDAQAKAEYRKRVDELDEEIEEAESFNDPVRAEHAQTELDAIVEVLKTSLGLGGRDRRSRTSTERARLSVRKAIGASIDRIAEHLPDLAEHLRTSVRTGRSCSYSPKNP